MQALRSRTGELRDERRADGSSDPRRQDEGARPDRVPVRRSRGRHCVEALRSGSADRGGCGDLRGRHPRISPTIPIPAVRSDMLDYEYAARGVCGDDRLNQPSEECDGAADAACPGDCGAALGFFPCLCQDKPRTRVIEHANADLDNGWSGQSHDSGIVEGGGYVTDLWDCDGPGGPDVDLQRRAELQSATASALQPGPDAVGVDADTHLSGRRQLLSQDGRRRRPGRIARSTSRSVARRRLRLHDPGDRCVTSPTARLCRSRRAASRSASSTRSRRT